MRAKAIKLGSRDKHSVYYQDFNGDEWYIFRTKLLLLHDTKVYGSMYRILTPIMET